MKNYIYLFSIILSSILMTACEEETIILPETAIAKCVYMNAFSEGEECREYLGSNWTYEKAEDDCLGQAGTLTKDEKCEYQEITGRCVFDGNTDDVSQWVFPGNDASGCEWGKRGCELFSGGKFFPEGACAGVEYKEGGIAVGVFKQPILMCVEPLDGEEDGLSEDGKVCTRNSISSCTEEGRKFNEYSVCDDVYQQRGYYPAPPNIVELDDNDVRLGNEEYKREADWAKAQIESCGCVCCHTETVAPEGPSNWFVEAQPFWTDSFYDKGLAIAAGWISTESMGAYPPEENNGFDRSVTGMPTTDVDRMVKFFESELERRGKTRADFADTPYLNDPMSQQFNYKIEDCKNGEGINEDGLVTWVGGEARYVYVLENGSHNPTVPPNMDLPEGTLWRVDTPFEGTPMKSPIKYGELPKTTEQKFPSSNDPRQLEKGKEYHIYVLEDVIKPITRCRFKY